MVETARDAVISVMDRDPTSCFRIKAVLGLSMCLKMSATEKRLGCNSYDDDDM